MDRTGATRSSSGGAPGNLGKDRLDNTGPGFGLRQRNGGLAIKFDKRTAQPGVGLVHAAKGHLGQRLNPQEPDGAIRLLNGERLVLLSAVPAGPLRDDPPIDLLIRQTGLRQSP